MDELRPDIEAARGKMSVKAGAGREIKRLVEHLWPEELVRTMTRGAYGSGTGLVVLTSRRLLFLKEGLTSKKSEDFPLDKISSVQWSSGMLLGTIAVFASGNKAEITQVDKSDGKALCDQLRNILAAGPPEPAAPASAGALTTAAPDATQPAAPDVYGQLRQLGDLRDAGILTSEEFDAKKAELLSRI